MMAQLTQRDRESQADRQTDRQTESNNDGGVCNWCLETDTVVVAGVDAGWYG